MGWNEKHPKEINMCNCVRLGTDEQVAEFEQLLAENIEIIS